MLSPMKTTVRLDDQLLQRASQEAGRRGVSLATLIEQGLQLVLRVPFKSPDQRVVDVSVRRVEDAIRPGVNLTNRGSLLNRIYRRD
jgi:hypothetical protein